MQPIVLLLHIPKAGGTTLCNWIYEQVRGPVAEEDRWFKGGVFYYPSGYVRGPYPNDLSAIQRSLARSDLRAVLGHAHFGLHEQVRPGAIYITVLREPVERVASLFHFQRLIEERQGSHQGVTIPARMTLQEFVEDPPYVEIDNGQTRRLAGIDPAVRECPGWALDAAKRNIERQFAVTGVLERFDETLLMLKREFGWNRRVAYFPSNENPGRPSTCEIPPDVIEVIKQRNALDCALYEHVRGAFDRQVESAGRGFQDALQRFRSEQHALRQELFRARIRSAAGRRSEVADNPAKT